MATRRWKMGARTGNSHMMRVMIRPEVWRKLQIVAEQKSQKASDIVRDAVEQVTKNIPDGDGEGRAA